MAVKYYCDGCDKEIAKRSYDKKYRVSISSECDDDETETGPYDLCATCHDRLDPKQWPRYAPERKTGQS